MLVQEIRLFLKEIDYLSISEITRRVNFFCVN